MVITERGCAKQVYQYQALERGKWKTITTIMEETYTSGCVRDSDWAEHLATDTEYCYCDHNRCNDDRLLAQGEEEEGEEEGEEGSPLRSDYQHNFIESNGLQVLVSDISNPTFTLVFPRWPRMELKKQTSTT